MSRIVGLDVGGANLKYAAIDGTAARRRFPLWNSADALADVLWEDLRRLEPIDALAVTMTGELADCFADRAVGVAHIVDHVMRAAQRIGLHRLGFYGVDGRFSDAAAAARAPDRIAAANWHVLASEVAASVASGGLLIDIGSTTTDIVPLVDGKVATPSRTDHDRLCEGSLVYVGCRRTPVCAFVDRLVVQGCESPVINEVFATIDDARLVLGLHPAAGDDHDSADGQPRTPRHAANRLARMVGLDRRQVGIDGARELAEQVFRAGRQLITQSVRALSHAGPGPWILSGHGQDLLELPPGQPVIDLTEVWGRSVSRCAPSFAVARRWAALQATEEAADTDA